MADLKIISIVVGLTISMASVAWGVVSFAQSLQPKVEAMAQHEVLHERVSAVDDKADNALVQTTTIGRDVKTIKCILMAPNRKGKERCGLE